MYHVSLLKNTNEERRGGGEEEDSRGKESSRHGRKKGNPFPPSSFRLPSLQGSSCPPSFLPSFLLSSTNAVGGIGERAAGKWKERKKEGNSRGKTSPPDLKKISSSQPRGKGSVETKRRK